MKNTERLAKTLRERDNPYYIGTVIGRITATDPLTVEIQMPIGDPLRIERPKVAARLCRGDKRETVIKTTSAAGDPSHTHEDSETTITTKSHLLQVGDSVIVTAAMNNSVFYILDKVGDWA